MYRSYGSSVPNSHPFLDVDSAIRGLTQDFCTAFNTGNYDQAAALFAPDGLFMPAHHESAQGPKAVEHALREFGEGGYQDLRLESTRVDHSGDMAVEIGRYTLAIQQANGTTVVDRGKFVHAWRRLGVWLLVATAWNSSLPLGK
jgi:uncharacterized protein (TIGR02246 family)